MVIYPHYVYIKHFNSFTYNKTKHTEKKHFCRYCLQCFSDERYREHKKVCLNVNGEMLK